MSTDTSMCMSEVAGLRIYFALFILARQQQNIKNIFFLFCVHPWIYDHDWDTMLWCT